MWALWKIAQLLWTHLQSPAWHKTPRLPLPVALKSPTQQSHWGSAGALHQPAPQYWRLVMMRPCWSADLLDTGDCHSPALEPGNTQSFLPGLCILSYRDPPRSPSEGPGRSVSGLPLQSYCSEELLCRGFGGWPGKEGGATRPPLRASMSIVPWSLTANCSLPH